MSNALLPKACRCGRLDGAIADNAVVCAGCDNKRADISAISQKVLADSVRFFGEPKEPVVFRRPGAAEKIKQQDEFLKRKRRSDGKAWFDIITENLDENFLGEDPGIDPDPIGTDIGVHEEQPSESNSRTSANPPPDGIGQIHDP